MTTATVTLTGYTCIGSVRGQCGTRHKTLEAAERCCANDADGCRSQRGYSDREVMIVGSDGYLYVGSDGYLYYDEECQEWVPALGGRTSGEMQAACK